MKRCGQQKPRPVLIDADLLVRALAAGPLMVAGFDVTAASDGTNGLAKAGNVNRP